MTPADAGTPWLRGDGSALPRFAVPVPELRIVVVGHAAARALARELRAVGFGALANAILGRLP